MGNSLVSPSRRGGTTRSPPSHFIAEETKQVTRPACSARRRGRRVESYPPHRGPQPRSCPGTGELTDRYFKVLRTHTTLRQHLRRPRDVGIRTVIAGTVTRKTSLPWAGTGTALHECASLLTTLRDRKAPYPPWLSISCFSVSC